MNSVVKIKKVYPKENYILECEFENGIKKEYDLKPLIEKYTIFNKLKENKKLFEKVIVDIGGYGISWNEEIDLAVEELWENGEDVCPEKLYYESKEINKKKNKKINKNK